MNRSVFFFKSERMAKKTEHRNGTPRARKEIGTSFRSDVPFRFGPVPFRFVRRAISHQDTAMGISDGKREMNNTEAHALLDRVRSGIDVPKPQIIEALIATGDMSEDAPPMQVHCQSGEWQTGPVRRADVFDMVLA